MMAVEHLFPADLLTQPSAARRAYFRALTIGHPALRAAYEELRCAIRDAAPGSLILVSGPAGVGKTTLLQRVEREITEELLPELPFISVADQSGARRTLLPLSGLAGDCYFIRRAPGRSTGGRPFTAHPSRRTGGRGSLAGSAT